MTSTNYNYIQNKVLASLYTATNYMATYVINDLKIIGNSDNTQIIRVLNYVTEFQMIYNWGYNSNTNNILYKVLYHIVSTNYNFIVSVQ